MTITANAATNHTFITASERIRWRPRTQRSVGSWVSTTLAAPNVNSTPIVVLSMPNVEAYTGMNANRKPKPRPMAMSVASRRDEEAVAEDPAEAADGGAEPSRCTRPDGMPGRTARKTT